MPVNPVAENVLGTIGLIIWTVQIIPQIYKSWAERSTEGLSPWLVLLWGISEGMLGAYTVLRSINVPLILQPHLFGALALVSWGQCQYYGGQRSAWRASLMALGAMLLIGGAEAGIVFAVRPAYNAGSAAGERGVQFLGLFSSVLFVLGLLPQYVEVWRRREVVGISILFMTCDMLGGMFSDLSLVFKSEFDVIAGMSYTLVIVMDSAILIAAIILNPRAQRRRKQLEGLAMAQVPSTLGVTEPALPYAGLLTSAESGDSIEIEALKDPEAGRWKVSLWQHFIAAALPQRKSNPRDYDYRRLPQ